MVLKFDHVLKHLFKLPRAWLHSFRHTYDILGLWNDYFWPFYGFLRLTYKISTYYMVLKLYHVLKRLFKLLRAWLHSFRHTYVILGCEMIIFGHFMGFCV